MINDTSKPLIFLGSNYNIHWLVDVAKRVGYDIAGIIDDDYHGQGQFQDIPIIAKQQDLIDNTDYRRRFQFFCATNWQPADLVDIYQKRNAEKRHQLISLMDELSLDVATIVSASAEVSSYKTTIGKGTFIDSFCLVSPCVTIGNYTNLYSHANVGDHVVIGNNCMIQRNTQIIGGVTLGNNVYMGFYSLAGKKDILLADGTFVHPSITVMRNTNPDEVVSLVGKDLRKIYNRIKDE
jgi:UDP-3-O-[3-hydroxymyristoyl] glucosamine N-acyltransferase